MRDGGVPPPDAIAMARRVEVDFQAITGGQYGYIVGRRLHYAHTVAMNVCGN